MNILILGANGALGSELRELLAVQKPVCFDKDDLDITNESAVAAKVSELKPEVIFNCAAYNEVDQAEEERQLAENVNGAAVGFIAKAAAAVGAILVHFSSNYVFDGQKSEGYSEDDMPSPLSAYGTSKLMGEIELQKNTDRFYLVRTAWLYGGSNKETGKKSFPEKMIELSKEEQSIDCIEDEFGNPTYVPDLAKTVLNLVNSSAPFGIYHLINTGSASWYDWANEIFTIKGVPAKLAQVPAEKFQRKAARPKYGILNNTKLPELRPWTEALKEYLN